MRGRGLEVSDPNLDLNYFEKKWKSVNLYDDVQEILS